MTNEGMGESKDPTPKVLGLGCRTREQQMRFGNQQLSVQGWVGRAGVQDWVGCTELVCRVGVQSCVCKTGLGVQGWCADLVQGGCAELGVQDWAGCAGLVCRAFEQGWCAGLGVCRPAVRPVPPAGPLRPLPVHPC